MTGELIASFEGVGRTFAHGPSTVTAVRVATGIVCRGDRIAMMGQSGSGKSTLLHLLAGLDTPTSGTVTWPGIGKAVSLRPGPVGIVFQSPSLIPSLDVAENVSLPLILMGEGKRNAADATAAALDTLGISDLSAKLPEELSGGQSQRVAIARALAHRPTLILADEPTGQLDHDAARIVIDALIDAANATNAGLVVSTHDPEVADRFAIAWSMVDGHLAIEGDVLCSA